jgi:hypothetical protein
MNIKAFPSSYLTALLVSANIGIFRCLNLTFLFEQIPPKLKIYCSKRAIKVVVRGSVMRKDGT